MPGNLNWMAAVVLVLGLLAGCGGGGGETAAGPNITAAAGGTVKSADGRVTLVVPPGAASRDMTLRIVPATPQAPSNIGLLAGYAYALEGDGGGLSAAAELRVAFDAGVLQAAAATDRMRALAGAIAHLPLIKCDVALGFVAVPVDPYDLKGAWYCEKFPREPRLATVTRDAVVELGACVFDSALRIAACQTLNLTPQIFGVLHDNQPPAVSVVADKISLTVAGDVLLTATATDNKAVASVAISITRSVGGVLDPTSVETTAFTAPPYQLTRSFTHLDNGEWTVIAAATDFNKNASITGSALKVVINIPPPPVPDNTPPVVALGASSTAVTVGDTVALSATASDNVGVTKVEFFKGAVKIGERLALPYDLATAAFTAADVGVPQVFSAKAHDAAGNSSTSAAVTVTVGAASTGDVYVNATSGIDSNAGSAAAPFKTLAKAFTVVGSGGTVWLQNGVLTAASEGTDFITGRAVPVGISVRAVNALGATIGFPLKFAGDGSVVGTAFDMSANGFIAATSGNVTASRVQWVKLGAFGMIEALVLSGSAKLLLDNGGDATHEYFAAVGVARLASLTGAAELSVNGGRIDRLSGGGGSSMLMVGDDARLTMNAVTWTNAAGSVGNPTAIGINSVGGTVVLNGSTIDLTGAADFVNGGSACILLQSPSAVSTTSVTLDASVLKKCPGDGIQAREGTPTIVLKNGSQIADAGFHGLRSAVFGPAGNLAQPVLGLSNSQIVNSARSALEMLAGGSLAMTGMTISNNGLLLNNGGVRLLGAFTYSLSMRGSTVSDNLGDAGSGGVVMQGNAASSFDFGSKASPGGNTIKTNGLASTGLRATVAAGVTVLAVGNSFNANVQGSNASGAYLASSTVCSGANPCNVSTGSGVNFAITGGTLRLVDD